MFFAALGMLIGLPLYAAIYVYTRQQNQLAINYKERRLEEEHYQWLENMGLKETSFFFSPYGLRLLSIWSIRATAGGIFK